MFDRILVAVDQSRPAERALDIAIKLAEAGRSWLGVVHVVDPGAAFAPEMAFTNQATLAQLRRDGNRTLDSAFSRIPPALNAERIMLEGDPGELIIATACERVADLIVIGSESRGRLAHFLLGSTADAVIRKAPCPVISVRASTATPSTDPPVLNHEVVAQHAAEPVNT